MRIARRAFLTSSIGTAAVPAILRLARADTPPITLKLHHSFSAVSGVHDKFLLPWARKVESESGGRMRIDIFPSMQLGGAPAALLDQARDGSADIVWAAPGLTSGRFPKIETFELPFLPLRRALVNSKALTDFASANLQDEFRDFYPICFSCSDSAVIHAMRPVRTTEDMKDFKLHVQTRLAAEAMHALGAHPVMMPSAQLPVAITEHVVDGCLDPWHLVPPLRLNELLRSHTEFSDRSPSARTYVLAMNKATYDRLPGELKSVIDSNSGQVAAAMAGAMWDQQAAAVANMVVERGDLIVTLLPEAVARWRKATEPVIDAWRKEIKEQKLDGAKLIAAANALLAKYANEPEPQSSQASPPREQQAVSQPPQSQAPANAAPKPANPPASAGPSAGQPVRSAAQPASAAPRPPQPQPPAQAATAAPAPVSSVSPSPAAPPAAAPPGATTPAAANASTAPTASVAKPLAVQTPTGSAPTGSAPTVSAPAAATSPPASPPSAAAAQANVAASPPAAASPVPKSVPKTLDIRL
jgi:TRAP-type C4-dicarboxylate transport system substrate-binding protein